MKKIVLFALICILSFSLSSCGNAPEEIERRTKKEPFEMTDWRLTPADVFDEEMAIDVANAMIESLYGKEAVEETRLVLFEHEGQDIYHFMRIVEDVKDVRKIPIGAGEFHVVIQKRDGALIAAWLGE